MSSSKGSLGTDEERNDTRRNTNTDDRVDLSHRRGPGSSNSRPIQQASAEFISMPQSCYTPPTVTGTSSSQTATYEHAYTQQVSSWARVIQPTYGHHAEPHSHTTSLPTSCTHTTYSESFSEQVPIAPQPPSSMAGLSYRRGQHSGSSLTYGSLNTYRYVLSH